MTETKHTPGPWLVADKTFIYTLNERGTNVFWAHVQTGWKGKNAEFHTELSEVEANAKLIAAAPELLADLEEAAATLRRYETLHRAKGTDDSTAKAEVNAALASRFEATIAKATE